MQRATGFPVVHLELHTHDLCGASAFYGQLLRWRTERIEVRWGSYHALALGGPLNGGIVECGATRATWLPYVEVEEIEAITERGRRLGASVLLEPREGRRGGAACWPRARVARSRSGSPSSVSGAGGDDRVKAGRSRRRGGREGLRRAG